MNLGLSYINLYEPWLLLPWPFYFRRALNSPPFFSPTACARVHPPVKASAARTRATRVAWHSDAANNKEHAQDRAFKAIPIDQIPRVRRMRARRGLDRSDGKGLRVAKLPTCMAKLKVMNSTMGLSPAKAEPTPMPVNPASVMGVSYTRAGPNFWSSPRVICDRTRRGS
eukprot:5270071-Pyramimonas_sp.AAC.1